MWFPDKVHHHAVCCSHIRWHGILADNILTILGVEDGYIAMVFVHLDNMLLMIGGIKT
jgi:hypothetical protein